MFAWTCVQLYTQTNTTGLYIRNIVFFSFHHYYYHHRRGLHCRCRCRLRHHFSILCLGCVVYVVGSRWARDSVFWIYINRNNNNTKITLYQFRFSWHTRRVRTSHRCVFGPVRFDGMRSNVRWVRTNAIWMLCGFNVRFVLFGGVCVSVCVFACVSANRLMFFK